ncbi:hypothetical protein H4R20_001623 [Coemansia guatemalensis]|uniref:EF-hand n=1 Tax=Coemansia guatemalensis TaxID=2761395 RepID=A0A9W8HYV2_9FUNG|nr:hypothetical protein H4R20_001623 [Coemansia guatemalensis]
MDSMRENARSDGPWRPTSREQGAYAYLLSLVDPQKEGIIRGQAAVPFFQKSRLPDATLGGIWQLADTDSKGHLTSHEFSIAMKLISLAQAQRPVALGSIADEVSLPDMEGINLQHILSSPSSTSISETHARRDSNTSSVGWSNLMAGAVASRDSLAEATVPAKEKQQYKRIFESGNPVDGAISGASARNLFMRTKLSTEQLGRIWALADPHSEGKLRLPGFIVAMYYIRRIMDNRNFELPATCPLSLWRSAGGDVSLKSPADNLSQNSLTSMSTPDLSDAQWDVTKEEWKRYEQYFNNLDTQRAGYLSGDVPVNFFLKSKLPETALSKVWDLADIKRTGKLTKEEFAVAMHLINARLAGGPIPDKLPPTLVPPSMRKASIVSTSMHSLSPPLRPTSAGDRAQLSDNLKRTTTYAPSSARAPMPTGMSRTSTGRSNAPLSATAADEGDLTALQNQLGQMEDISRGLQSQRYDTTNQLAVAGARKQELEMRLAAVQSSHDVEQRINQELQEKLKGEEARVSALQAQVTEANKRLSVVSAQREQLEQEVHRVQTQQLAMEQRLGQAQDDERQLNSEIAALEQQKKQLEQNLSTAQEQITRLQQTSQELAARSNSLKGDVGTLTQKVADATSAAEALDKSVRAQAAAAAASTEQNGLSFEDVFGTGDSQIVSADSAEFNINHAELAAGRSESLPQQHAPSLTAEMAGSAFAGTGSLPVHMSLAQTPPALPAGAAASSGHTAIGQSLPVASAKAFDSFGMHSADPFEEFLHTTASTKPIISGAAAAAENANAEFGQLDAILGHGPGHTVTRSLTKPMERVASQSMSDPRSVTSTPAPAGRSEKQGESAGAAHSTPSSPPPPPGNAPSDITNENNKSSAASGQDFAADFSTAFGMMPSTSERAINQDIEAFTTKFPDIDALAISEDVNKPVNGTATGIAKSKSADGSEELTFESVFGAGGNGAADELGAAGGKTDAAGAENKAKTTQSAPQSQAGDRPSDSKADKSKASNEEDVFVPPPVVKRTNVSARPMSRVLSIFRSSSSSGGRGGGLLSGVPALPKRATTEKRQPQTRDQDKKFEEQWAAGDWPEWVKKGEHIHARRMLTEMGYPKDRVVEALEVNDFNLAQATDYLLSS